MLNVLRSTTSRHLFASSTETEMRWENLATIMSNKNTGASSAMTASSQADASFKVFSEKKFEKDSDNNWIWYKNQVLPTLKVKSSSNLNASLHMRGTTAQLTFAHVQCFAIFSNQAQVIEVKLDGATCVKLDKDFSADLRSIRLTETINSLNCRYFLLTVNIFEANEGEDQIFLKHRQDQIDAGNVEAIQRLARNTMVSQCISIQTRKKSLHQRISLLCQMHPFVPKEFKRVLQMLQGTNPDEILSADTRGLFFYFSNKKIRHKIYHPLYLASRFNECIKLFYDFTALKENQPTEEDNSLQSIFFNVQQSIESQLLQQERSNSKYSNRPTLLIQVVHCNITQQEGAYYNKVLNYLSPLQSSAIRIIGENDVIPTTYKPIVYEESEYTEAYTRVFPSILNTLFEYQENRVKYPNYLNSVGYSAQKEETIEYQKDVALRDRTTIKYKTTLEHKYDEKLKTKLARVPVYSTANQPSHSSFLHLQFQQQQQQQQQQHHGIDAQIHSMKIETPESIAAKNSMMAVMRNLYANNQETNRGSLMSNSSDTVIATHPLGATAAIVSQQQHQNDLLREQHLNMFADADDTHSQVGEEEPRTRKARKLDTESSNKNAAAFNNKISLTTPSSKNITTTSFPLLHSFDDLNKGHMNTVQQFSPNHMSAIGASATAPSTADITSFQNHMMMPNCNMIALIQQQQLQNNNNNNNKHFQNDVLAAYIQANSAMNVNLQQFQQQQQQQQQQQAFAAMILAEQQRNLFQNSNATNVLAAAQNPFMFNQHAAFQQQQQQQQLLEQLAQHQALYPIIRQ